MVSQALTVRRIVVLKSSSDENQMTVLSEQENCKVNEDARRLRLIHADAARAAPEKRRDHLREELERILKPLPVNERKAYLKSLLARFPVGGLAAASAPSAVAAPRPAPAAQPQVPKTPEELLELFLAAASKLPEERRAGLSRRLTEKGFGSVDKGAMEMEISDELRQRFGLSAGQQPRLARVVELAAWLVDLSWRLDQTTFNVWGEMSKGSALAKRHQDFRVVAARFLSGDDEVIEAHLSAFSTLIGALLVAIQQGGKEFERYYAQRFAPEAIEETVATEGVGMLQNKNDLCWKKYRDLAKDFAAPGVIDKQIKDSYVKIVDATFRGNR